MTATSPAMEAMHVHADLIADQRNSIARHGYTPAPDARHTEDGCCMEPMVCAQRVSTRVTWALRHPDGRVEQIGDEGAARCAHDKSPMADLVRIMSHMENVIDGTEIVVEPDSAEDHLAGSPVAATPETVQTVQVLHHLDYEPPTGDAWCRECQLVFATRALAEAHTSEPFEWIDGSCGGCSPCRSSYGKKLT